MQIIAPSGIIKPKALKMKFGHCLKSKEKVELEQVEEIFFLVTRGARNSKSQNHLAL
jgi:hypothetical protein